MYYLYACVSIFSPEIVQAGAVKGLIREHKTIFLLLFFIFYFFAGWSVSALPPPNYEDAILFPVSSSSCGDILGEAATASAVHAHKDVLPSYDTACASADRFQLTVSPASSPRKADGGVSRSLGERASSSTPPSVSESSFSSPATAVYTAPRVPPLLLLLFRVGERRWTWGLPPVTGR